MKTLLSFISILAFCSFSFADTLNPPQKISPPAPTASPQSISPAELELKVSKMQIETMKDYQSSLLDTVYWALGTVATVTVLLIGFGWFANFKFHESEKQRLKDELDARLREALASFETQLSSSEVAVIKLVDARLDSHLTRIARDIDIARSELSRLYQENSEAIKQLKVETSKLQEKTIENQKMDSELEAALREVEAHVWTLKGIPTNTLITQSQGLRAAISAEHRYYISSVLERMHRTIRDSILPAKKTMSELILRGIKEDVDEAAKIEPVAAAKVRELLEQITITPEIEPG